MAQYFIAINNQQMGPFALDQLLANGLTPETLVWANGMANWTKAQDVPEVAALFVAQQPQYQQPQYQQPQYQQPQYQQPQYQQQPQPQYQQPAYQAAAFSQPGAASKQKADMFLMANRDNFPPERIPYIQERLYAADENTINTLSMLQFKNPITALILSLFLGALGIDRFYLGDTGMGIGKLLTGGGCGIWALIDLFMIMGAARQKNMDMLAPYL